MKPSTEDVISAAGQNGPAADYWCGNPGGVVARSSNLGGCTWCFDPTSILGSDQSIPLTLVAKDSNSNNNCTKHSDCPRGFVCGTLQQLDEAGGPGPNLFPGRCGRFIGFLNADRICEWTQGVSNPNTFPNRPPFSCKTNIGPGTFSELYGCSGPYSTSGYNCNPGNSMLCGCPAWESIGINAPATSPCQCDNTDWQKNSLPWIQWMKKACPTAYTYPFDDASSTFQCQNQDGTVGYTITFCPDGKSLTQAAVTSVVPNSAVGIGEHLCSFAVTAILM